MTPGFTRYAPIAGPSRWLLIAGRRFIACVENTASDAVVDAVWWLAGSELATIESVVGAFPLAGPDSVRSFAVAELGEPNAAGEIVVTAVVRGSAVVDVFSVGGSRRFGSGGVQPWVLAEFRSVTGLAVGGEDLPSGPVARLTIGSLPLGLGVVDGALLTWSSTPLARVERTADRTAERAASPISGTEAGRHTGSTQARQADLEETVIRDRNQPAPGDTPGRDTARAQADALPPADPLDVPPARPRFAVRVVPGDAMELDVPVLIGRSPALPRVTAGVPPRLVAVRSPENEVSSTHLRIEQSGDAVVVTDLRSTNGTRVVRPGGVTSRLRPGESTVALSGTVVEIGDGNIIEITAIPAGGSAGVPRPLPDADPREEGRE